MRGDQEEMSGLGTEMLQKSHTTPRHAPPPHPPTPTHNTHITSPMLGCFRGPPGLPGLITVLI